MDCPPDISHSDRVLTQRVKLNVIIAVVGSPALKLEYQTIIFYACLFISRSALDERLMFLRSTFLLVGLGLKFLDNGSDGPLTHRHEIYAQFNVGSSLKTYFLFFTHL